MIFASMMGRRFAIVVPRRGQIPIEEDNLVLYKTRSLAIENKPIRSLHTKMSLTAETMFGDIDTDGVLADFRKVAGSCIEDGAEVLIPGCSALSLMLALSGVKEVDAVRILQQSLQKRWKREKAGFSSSLETNRCGTRPFRKSANPDAWSRRRRVGKPRLSWWLAEG